MRFLTRKHLLFRRGQSISEYMFVFGLVAVTLISMQIYMKRGIQAVVKVATDELGGQQAEETDPEKGTLSNTTFYTTDDRTSRLATQEGGSQTNEFNLNTTITGEGTYVSKEEE